MRPALVLGTAQFDRNYGCVPRADQLMDVCGLLNEATMSGIEVLDTAPAYGEAERQIGQCHWGGKVHTKISGEADPFLSLTASLNDLRADVADVVYFHDPSIVNKSVDFFEQTYDRLVPSLANRLGVSVYTSEEFEKALQIGFIGAIQVPMNIVDPRITDEHLSEAQAAGKQVYARSIFLQGTLLTSPDTLPGFLSNLAPVVNELERIAHQHGKSVMSLLIRAVRDRPGLTGLVIGVESESHLRQVVAAYAEESFPDALREQLESLKIHDSNLLDPRVWGIENV